MLRIVRKSTLDKLRIDINFAKETLDYTDQALMKHIEAMGLLSTVLPERVVDTRAPMLLVKDVMAHIKNLQDLVDALQAENTKLKTPLAAKAQDVVNRMLRI